VSGQTLSAVRPPSYPARPINGGRLELAPPKPGQWCYEPKYNGWRVLVHAPTGLMFNRYAQPLSIAAEFACALQYLRKIVLRAGGTAVEWFDCEALDRRHALGRGTLMVFDYLSASGQLWPQRKEILAQALAGHDYRQVPRPEALYGVPAHDPAQIDPQELYRQLRQLNARWGCHFYEGLVAKRTSDAYPLQLRSPHQEFVGWVKHRWAGCR
jgi:hypothetical protein